MRIIQPNRRKIPVTLLLLASAYLATSGCPCVQAQFLDEPTDVDTILPAAEGEQLVPAVAVGGKDPGKTFGPDNPFTIYGKAQAKRSNAYRLATETRAEVLRSLRFGTVSDPTRQPSAKRVSWKFPIVIQLTESVATPTREARSGVRVMPDGSLSLTIHVDHGFALPRIAFEEEVTRQVLTDFMLRGLPAGQVEEQTVVLTAPDWLLYGTLELMNFRQRGRPSELFNSVFQLGKTLTVQEILNADVRGLDAVTMGIYRVSACALLQLLLDQPDGPLRLETMLGLLPRTKEPVIALEASFPQLRGQKNSLEKWWSIQLAASAQPGKTDLLTMEQSEHRLAEALRIYLPQQEMPPKSPGLLSKIGNLFSKNSPSKASDPATAVAANQPPPAVGSMQLKSLNEWKDLTNRKDRKVLLQPCQLALTELNYRIHPFYRRLVREYISLAAEIAAGKTRKIDDRLTAAKLQRQIMVKEAQETEDFMDHYEATSVPYESGKFRDYLRTAEEIKRKPSTSIAEITEYMDQMEREFAP